MRRSSPCRREAGSNIATPGPIELHQVLVGGDDQHVGAALARLPRIGGDEVVGLVAVLLDRREAEGAHGRAHQRELRHEILRRLGPVRLVGRIELAAERILRLVEDDRQMRRRDPRRAVAQELQHLGREQPHRADRQPVGAVIVFLILPDRLEIGAEDEGRAVDEKDVVAGADGTGLGHGAIVDKARGGGYRRAGAAFDSAAAKRQKPAATMAASRGFTAPALRPRAWFQSPYPRHARRFAVLRARAADC